MKRAELVLLLCVVAFGLTPGAMAQQVIPVANVDELYAAVNDPASRGAALVLLPGTYVLSPTGANGVIRPNGGRLELQPDMSLIGVEGDRSAVVIDAFNLPAASFPLTRGPNAAIRMGLGHNALEWLTIRDARNGQANIDSGLQPLDPGTAFISIAHIASSGSTRGLNLLNFGPLASGQTIEADIVDSYFFDNVFKVSEGVRMGNFQGARGCTVNVRMVGNVSWGQKQGRLIVNNGGIESTINVTSSGNRFYDDGAGTVVIGGLSSTNTRADGNTINLDAHGDEFLNNTRETEFDKGGLVILASENISTIDGGGSHNTVNVKLWGCRTLNNNLWDLAGIASRSLSDQTASLSEDNHITVEIHGVGNGKWQPVEFFADQIPAEPNYGNSVTVIR